MSILSIKGPDKKIASLEKQWRLFCKRNGLEMVIRKSKADVEKEEAELKRQLELAVKIKEQKESNEKATQEVIEKEAQDVIDKKAKEDKAKADLRKQQEADTKLANEKKAQKIVDDANAAEEDELEKVRKNLEKIRKEEADTLESVKAKAKESDKTNGPKGAK